jgi:hypothetical protein
MLDYYPTTTVKAFMLNATALVRVLVGPYGSGKSMGCIMELVRRSCEQTPAPGTNIRYTRFAIIRNTLQQLKSTVLADIQQYLQGIVEFYVTDSTIKLRFGLPDGTQVHSDWPLIPLDTKEDQRRLLSLQLTGAWVNEVREVPIEIIDALIGRCGRYPGALMGGPSWFGVIADTNPWDTDSPYHEVCVLNPDPRYRLFHQPSGIGPYAENLVHLPPNYYENLMGTRGKEWSDVHVESMWGTSNAGQAVFRRSFDANTHVVDLTPVVNPHRPLMVAQDFGRTPCALLTQEDSLGRLIVFEEIVTEDMGLIMMLEERLKPKLGGDPYAGKRVFIIADPAGKERSQIGEECPFDVLKDEGFLAYPASTNSIQPRLTAVEKLFRSTIAGQPGVQISRAGCPNLVRALGSKYRYKKMRDGRLEDLPEKTHPWSDVADCLQYAALGANSHYSGRVLRRDQRFRPAAPRSQITAAGWT